MDLPDSRSLSDEIIEALRLRAIRGCELGYTAEEVAAILGVARETVSRWYAAYRRGGSAALPGDRTGRPTGSGRTLHHQQAQRVQDLIDTHCPDEVGIAAALWTRAAVRDLIFQEFGIRMPIRTVGLYLGRWGYTPQKPRRKSYKQDPQEVAEWLAIKYPEFEARARREDAEIQWADAMGVRSISHVGRGYARPGQTPELRVPGNRFSVNMISAVTNRGKVRFMTYRGRMNGALFITFLTRLLCGAEKKIFLIVDNLRVHESAAVQAWLADKQDRIEIVGLPKYSPELNPDEYLNCDVKGGINADGLPRDREELHAKLKRYMHKLAKLPGRIMSYFEHDCISYAAASTT